MRVLFFVLAVGAATAACGLESAGLGGGEDGGDLGADAGSPSLDGPVVGDASGAVDATLSDAGSDGDGASDEAASGPDGADEGAGSETGADGGGVDSGDGAPADACASVEICNNGVDDNCDGKIDCADPTCNSGWTCTAATVPTGWTIVEYVDNQRPTCSSGYGAPIDVVEGPAGVAAACGCACNITTPGTCEQGTFAVSVNGLVGCSNGPVNSPGNGGACSPATAKYQPTAGAKMQVGPLGYTPGSCTPSPTVSTPPVTYSGQGRVCQSAEGAGAGCTNGGVCAPAAQGSGFHLCVERDGVQACPAGFTQAHTVAAGVSDTRGCTKCTCGGASATCANASLSLFTASDCGDGGVSVPADGKCDNFPSPGGGGAPTYVAYEYTATVQGEGCPPSPVSPNGTVDLASPKTVCCQ